MERFAAPWKPTRATEMNILHRENLIVVPLPALRVNCTTTSPWRTPSIPSAFRKRTISIQRLSPNVTSLSHKIGEMSVTYSPLLSLPAELRDEIYELSFTPSLEEEVDLIETRGLLSTALLQTCRSIYYEARPFLLEAYARLWSEANFVVYGCTSTNQPLRSLLASLPNAVFTKINHLKLQLRDVNDTKPALRFRMLPERNGWIQEIVSDNRTGLRLKLPKRENGRVHLWWRRVDTLEEAAKDCREFEQRNGKIPIKEQMEAIWFQYQRSS